MDWWYQWPSTTLKTTLSGNKTYANAYSYHGNRLLQEVKNFMKFNQLKQLRAFRIFPDGTTVVAKSVFGQDFVEIFSPEEPILEKQKPYCIITLINIPEAIPPMRWYADGVHDEEWLLTNPTGTLEIEGIDYIKTYYTVLPCEEGCTPLDFTVCETDELYEELGIGVEKFCLPYRFDIESLPEELVESFIEKEGPILSASEEDPNNHCVYSYGGCQAEIIKFGSDDQGAYFLWKAYTEWSVIHPSLVTFSRTGLGFLLLKGFIQYLGNDLCKSQSIVKVDCCEKEPDINHDSDQRKREVKLWWEAEMGPWPQNCQGQDIWWIDDVPYCEVPELINMWRLFRMACIPVNPVFFYVLPKTKGGCPPFEWELEGIGTLTPGGYYGEYAAYELKSECSVFQDITCQQVLDGVKIKVRDRCDTGGYAESIKEITWDMTTATCCEVTAPVELYYWTSVMGCNQQQDLHAYYGCGPYEWDLSGGGTLEVDEDSAVYTSPATNPNCTMNPVITVKDCCGNTAQIRIAVNCYSGGGFSLGYNSYWWCPPCEDWGGPYDPCYNHLGVSSSSWDCWGSLGVYCESAAYPSCNPSSFEVCSPKVGGICQTPNDHTKSNCWSNQCGCGCGGGSCACDVLVDCRTTEMKEGGCCPINPFTGLPY